MDGRLDAFKNLPFCSSNETRVLDLGGASWRAAKEPKTYRKGSLKAAVISPTFPASCAERPTALGLEDTRAAVS